MSRLGLRELLGWSMLAIHIVSPRVLEAFFKVSGRGRKHPSTVTDLVNE